MTAPLPYTFRWLLFGRKIPFGYRWTLLESHLQALEYVERGAPRWFERVVARLARAEYIVRRFLQGARRVEKFGDTIGSIDDDGIDIEWSGLCPVQGDGTVDGRAAYYRSRGEGWSLCIAPPGETDALADDAFDYGEAKYFFPDGGYVSARVSEACIRRGVAAWRLAGRP